MVQSTGVKKIKCAVFISGNGSNLKSLIQFAKKKDSSISIELIISDNPKAKGLKFGKIFKITNKVFNYKNKKIAEKKIISEIRNKKIKLICLAGFMKILSKDFIKNLSNKLYEWTNCRWIITLSQSKGRLTKNQVETNKNKEILERVKKTEDYRKILENFPDAQLIDIEEQD